MLTRSRQVKIGYALAAIPAVFLPASYLAMAMWVFVRLVPALERGDSADPGPTLMIILTAGFYSTLIQWPFYLAWAVLSREITIRVRILWVIVLIVMNMFAIPWFLYCKYQGTAQTALVRGIRLAAVRRFFEVGTSQQNNTA